MKDDLVSDIDPFGDEMSRSGDGVMLTDNQGKVLMINEILLMAKEIFLTLLKSIRCGLAERIVLLCRLRILRTMTIICQFLDIKK